MVLGSKRERLNEGIWWCDECDVAVAIAFEVSINNGDENRNYNNDNTRVLFCTTMVRHSLVACRGQLASTP